MIPTSNTVFRKRRVARQGAGHSIDLWDLARAARAGCPGAISRLFGQVQPLFRQAARRVLRNPSDVEDAVQDSSIELLTMIRIYDPGLPPEPLLRSLARRRAIDIARRNARHQRPIDPGWCPASIPPGAVDRIMLGQLMAMIQTLPPTQREAINLLRVEGLSVREAALRSGRSDSALKVSAHRAGRRLRLQAGEGLALQ